MTPRRAAGRAPAPREQILVPVRCVAGGYVDDGGSTASAMLTQSATIGGLSGGWPERSAQY